MIGERTSSGCTSRSKRAEDCMGMVEEYTVHGRRECSRKFGIIGLVSGYDPHDEV
jgi:hypothetical protein